MDGKDVENQQAGEKIRWSLPPQGSKARC
jgi:hypothetical protein